MAQELAIDMLVVSRQEQPPADAAIARTLAAGGLGTPEYVPAESRMQSTPAPGARQRIGTYTVQAPPGLHATCKLPVFHYGGAVTEGMSESAFHALTQGLGAEDVRTLREGTIALELRVTSSDQQVPRVLDWAIHLVRVLVDLSHGACVDPAAQRCYGLAELQRFAARDPLAHVNFHNEAWDADSRWLHTHGLQKLARPELDLVAVPLSLEDEGLGFLREVAASLAGGDHLAAGGEIDMGELGTVVSIGVAPDVDHQAPYGRLRLADAALPGELQGISIIRLLVRMALADARRHADSADVAGALAAIERVLAADPDECTALTLKARLSLDCGDAALALDLGEYMELRVPGDYRGPLTVGLALCALGRYREALQALNRAIKVEPEAADAFAVRSLVHGRMGHERLASEDHAHALYLGYRG
ncbi:MAG TPA: tetratricopeptide repeat protein [Ktedonobacterales bacterium]|nr:tetratricopeptide repeat protein [Ktedonobacterales bacterium]